LTSAVGIYVYQKGEGRYEGEWRLGKRHGRGVMITSAGDRYEGEWFNGEKKGFGTLYLSTGEVTAASLSLFLSLSLSFSLCFVSGFSGYC
jgi:hypothetical protein